ncbi:Serine/threonine kinase 23 [Ceratobasidium theobromae]|uniref:Serine/threonine kinase 23 n=1 Tax=Ceratobasidium theobromae TaxID=1582974 RepID=A0A5N5QTZ9_9AGAM|nr:Serine/threonine kinase 23 [Ceratobasidium theobromae]
MSTPQPSKTPKGNPSPKHKAAVPVAVKPSVYDRLAGAGGGAALAGANVLPSPINSVTNSSGTVFALISRVSVASVASIMAYLA